MELGITTFAETYPDPETGETIGHGQRLRQVIEEIEMAEMVGLDVYGIGEHHRPDFAGSAPAVILAVAAGATRRIRLSSAVIILSSADPVRTFQEFATLDQLSSGRAELMVGRGSFIESFPLFGFSLSDYEELFTEKLDLLLRIRDEERVTWEGKHRPRLDGQGIHPRPFQDPLPVWVAVGGSPESIVRAGRAGLPVALAIIGGDPDRFAPLAQLHRRVLANAGHDSVAAPLAVHAHGYVGESTDVAAGEYFGSYAIAMTQLGTERGWGPMTRQQYDTLRAPGGSLVLGDPERVAAKITHMRQVLGIDRFMLHISVGTMPHDKVLRSIELLGTEVAPLVRQ